MANPYHHACSSAQRWGGKPADYQAIHDWFDASKEFMPDFRHWALRHHAQGIFECERVFGHAIKNSAGRIIPVRWIGDDLPPSMTPGFKLGFCPPTDQPCVVAEAQP